MIEVNKRMTWEEAIDLYGGKKVLMHEVEKLQIDWHNVPGVMDIKYIIENMDDLEAADEEAFNSEYYWNTYLLPNTKEPSPFAYDPFVCITL